MSMGLKADNGALAGWVARKERLDVVCNVLQLVPWLLVVASGDNHLIDVLRRDESSLLVSVHI